MSKIAIKVENLSKAYQLGNIGTGTISRDIERWWAKMRGKEDPFLRIGETNDRTTKSESNIVWSLKDINFEIQQGDAVGIIGRNGAGKSTLLKILSRVTAPTTGKISGNGRIASLLEVGTGFHPELTGRENIYLNGAILGMRKREIDRKFDEIVDFSGVERYIDTPVKRYSSGMYVRLAFAVAAHLESEILIVDEVLAVGDAEFQKKCLGKMGDISTNEGRTVLFVSHQMDAINRLCKSTVVLDNGSILFKGNSNEAISHYLKGEKGTYSHRSWIGMNNAPGNQIVKLRDVSILNQCGEISEVLKINEPIYIKFSYEVIVDEIEFTHGLNLYNQSGIHILSSHDLITSKKKLKFSRGIYEARLEIPKNLLAEGLHQISVAIMSYNPFFIHFHETDAAIFTVVDTLDGTSARGEYGGSFPGVVRPMLFWENKKIF